MHWNKLFDIIELFIQHHITDPYKTQGWREGIAGDTTPIMITRGTKSLADLLE